MKKSLKTYFWGIGDAGEGLISMVTSTYFIIYLTDTAMLPMGMVAVISTIAGVVDFLLVPVAGTILVSTRAMRWGRYQSWLLICPPLVILLNLLCFTVIRDSQWMTAVCALVGYLGGKAAWNLAYAANVSLTATLSRKYRTATKMTSQRMMGSNIGRMLGNSLTPVLVGAASARLGAAGAYRLTVLIMGAVYVVTSLLHFWISDGGRDAGSAEEAAPTQLKLREVLRIFAVEPKLVLTMVVDLTSNVASLVLPSLAVYYYKYFSTGDAMLSTHMLIIGFGGLAGASLVRLLGDQIRRARPTLVTMYATVAVSLLSIRLFPDSVHYFLVIGAVVALLTGMTSPVEQTLYMGHAAHFREKTGHDATGFIMSMANFPVKFASLIKSTLIPFVLMSSGYSATAGPTAQVKQAIINAYTLIPVLFPICGIVLLTFCYRAKNRAGCLNK